MTTWYKVTNDGLGSVCANTDLPDRYRVVYAPNVWVYPQVHKTKLFVFNDVNFARSFMELFFYHTVRLFECEVQNPAPCIPAAIWSVDAYWEAAPEARKVHQSIKPPAGSYGCDAVKLLKEIPIE